MTLYLLDTNICVYTMNERPAPVGQRLEQMVGAGHAIGISSVTLYELWYGVHRSARPDFNAARLQTLATTLDVHPFGAEAAEQAAQIRAALSQRGQPIGPYDLLIAGHALALGAVVVTNNAGELKRVEGVQVEDWVTGR